MSAKEVKVYPIAGRYLNDVPHVTQVIGTTAEAEKLIATGAFTDNPRHPDRVPDAPEATNETSADAGVSDLNQE